MNSEYILQANPLAQYLAHEEEIKAAIHGVLARGHYILGDETRAFEQEFANFIGVSHAIGVSSGTSALTLALRAQGIKHGDEVITTPHTAVATIAAIELAGATPVLADVEPETGLLDPVKAEAQISTRTKAIVPVHLFGQPVDLSQFVKIARKYSIYLIEDCAQAHGALFSGEKVGSWGDVSCFSFYPTKNLGAIGDGGMVVTNDSDIANRVRALREYGWKERFISEIPGANCRLDELQAAILRVKLIYLENDNNERKAIADRYTKELSEQLLTPVVRKNRVSVFHQYVVRTPERDQLRRALHEKGIGTAVHYPLPVHLQPAYRGRLGNVGSFPHAEKLAAEILSLPIYPGLSQSAIERVITEIQCCNSTIVIRR